MAINTQGLKTTFHPSIVEVRKAMVPSGKGCLRVSQNNRRGGGNEGGLLFPQIAEGNAHKIDQRCGHIFEYKMIVTHWEGEREVDKF
ncbi:hypothetical protein I308_105683 [Cryptococcus tetragattii IND107]|uniref:Uncharacterized protein n=1 Tax=Cryptococcus tetragattii IND107 TaxID=1296105 RepID=A0ABR3BLN3_9TREE